MMTLLAAVGIMGALTFLLTTFLWYAGLRLQVDEDPRIDAVEAMLPHANCGACGFAGCRAFATALVSGAAQPAACSVASAAEHARIAGFLGVEAGRQVKRVARLACAGGSNVARRNAHYSGVPSCQAAAQVAGGGMACSWGCLGFGDCDHACDFGAITMNRHGLPVVNPDRCTACGDCVDACPRGLFSIERADNRLWVRCRNEDQGDRILEDCEVACTACGRCAMDAPEAGIRIHNGLPRLDQGLLCRQPEDLVRRSIDRCPTGAIVWINDDEADVHGRQSKRSSRQSPLPVVAG